MKTWIIFVCLALWLFPASNSLAIVTADNTVSASAPTTHDYDLAWEQVFGLTGGSAVAVDSFWLLTAKHVTSTSITQGDGVSRTRLATVSHPTADLKLLRYDKPFAGYYPIYSGTYPLPPPPRKTKLTALMVGFGVTGQVFSNYYTWDGPATAGTRRWGTSLIDGVGNGDIVSYPYIRMNFSSSATLHEGGAGDRDSGGGVFVKSDGVWYLAGILTAVMNDPGDKERKTGVVAADLTQFGDWISSTIAAYDATAEFSAAPVSTHVGQTVTFTDASFGGTVLTWAWEFGEGSTPATASTKGPHEVTYSSPGSKTVKLTVNGSSTETKTGYIAVTGVTSTGVPYTWLDTYDLVVEDDYETAAATDHSGNGLLAWQEYVADLDPTDPSSRLPKLALLTGEDGMIGISIEPTSLYRYYDLLSTVDLVHPDWQELSGSGSLGLGSGWRFDFVPGESGGAIFLRSRIRLP